MSQTTEPPDTRDVRKIPNPIRGCGTMERDKAYIKGITFRSEDGLLPSWVSLEPPIPFKEVSTENRMTRGFKRINGIAMQLAVEDSLTEFIPQAPPGTQYEPLGLENHVKAGLYDAMDEVPKQESQRHVDRLRERGSPGVRHFGEVDYYGETPVVDLMMRAGKSYYPNPREYELEARQVGISKAIAVSPNRKPPTVVRGITRCWIVHPNALGENEHGVIGYAYLDNSIYTMPEDEQIPQYIQDYEAHDMIETVDIEEPEQVEDIGHRTQSDRDDDGQTGIGDFDRDWFDTETRKGGAGGGTTTYYVCKDCGNEATGLADLDHADGCPNTGLEGNTDG